MRRLILPALLVVSACTADAAADTDPGGTTSAPAPAADDPPPSIDGAPAADTLPPVESTADGLATFVDADGSFVTVDRTTGETAHGRSDWNTRISLDGLVAASTTVVGGGDTALAWDSLTDAEVVGATLIEGEELEVTATQADGELVALVNPGTTVEGAIAEARSRSTIVVAGPEGGVWRTELDGNFVPEAFGRRTGFSGLPTQLFLLEYFPAEAPAYYRVRVLATESGEISPPVNIRDKSQLLDEQMAGFTRSQILADEHGLLFTLYTGTIDGSPDSEPYAFVHTLDLADGVWCLIVDDRLELDTLQGSLAVGGDELYVASPNGLVGSFAIPSISDIDEDPSMRWVRRVHAGGPHTPAAVADGDGASLAYGDGTLVSISPTGAPKGTTLLPGTGPTALAVDGDGAVHAAGPGWSTVGVTPPAGEVARLVLAD